MGVEIPQGADQVRKRGIVMVLSLPKYVVAMHHAERSGFGGSCDLLDSWGSESKLPHGTVKVEIVTPRAFKGPLPIYTFSGMIDSTVYELENPSGDPNVPDSLRKAYAQAKKFIEPKR